MSFLFSVFSVTVRFFECYPKKKKQKKIDSTSFVRRLTVSCDSIPLKLDSLYVGRSMFLFYFFFLKYIFVIFKVGWAGTGLK